MGGDTQRLTKVAAPVSTVRSVSVYVSWNARIGNWVALVCNSPIRNCINAALKSALGALRASTESRVSVNYQGAIMLSVPL